ncbi:DUF3443 family protein [Paraburkholderia sp. BCC1884]|uniref:DUF3443 family protein n=1 Tax=Paraburkholderia sp. BCC1884 TaxID=2562668 RepID=UPI001181FDE0|nr:DUF3443 family protein [Paraburkholderia sp. BCC1884]
MRKIAWIIAAALGLSLAGCGGGGGSSNNSSANSNSSTVSAPLAVSSPAVTNNSPPNVLAVDATAVPTDSTQANTVPVTVGATAINNQPMVSVTVCPPGSSANCATINNVIVDTGSVGLRLVSSAIPSATAALLTREPDGNGQTLAECALFGSGYAWGTVQQADVLLSGETASSVPIHVISDPALITAAPTDCTQGGGRALVTTSDLHANGILGIGSGQTDCGLACQNTVQTQFYYTNAGNTAQVLLANQITNPVAKFATPDNNGVILEMAQVADTGSASTYGTLVFGIDTQANNALTGTGASLIPTDVYNDFTSNYGGFTYSRTFFDSGSTVMFFPDLTIPTQIVSSTQYYVPSTPVGRTATLAGSNSSSITLGFNIASVLTLAATGNHAFNNIGAYQASPHQFDYGLPFFFGRHVYYGIDGKTSTGGGVGPYVAYVSK